jgi:hypothetical protein
LRRTIHDDDAQTVRAGPRIADMWLRWIET